MPRLPLSLFLLIALTADLSAQYGQWRMTTETRSDRFSNAFGFACASIGDQNGDGVPDFIVGDANFGISPGIGPGRVQILSGRDGSLIRQIIGFANGGRFGMDVSPAGDCTGDGVEDILVYADLDDYFGTLAPGSVSLYSGSTGQLIRTFRQSNPNALGFGASIAPFRDFDGDGFDDFLIGSPNEEFNHFQEGAIRVYLGATGSILLEITGGFEKAIIGRRVASGGDFDGDGIVDILTGSEGVKLPGGIALAGAVRVFSGVTGQELMRIGGDQREGGFGADVDFLSDLNGDGKDEFVVGAASGGTGFNTGTVEVFQGGNGALLFRHEHTKRNAQLGDSVASLGDVDGDSIPDYAGGAWGVTGVDFASGEVLVFSGADGFVIGRIKGANYYSSLGWDVAGIEDVNGDGRAEVLSVEPGFALPRNSAGRARIDSLDPFLQLTPHVLHSSSASIQTISMDLNFPISIAGHSYQILASTRRTVGLRHNPLDLPLDDGRLLRHTVSGNYADFPFSSGMMGQVNPQGQANAVLVFPPYSPILVPGSSLYFAAITYRPTGTVEGVSQSMLIRIE